MRSSAIFFVSVVTRTRWSRSSRARISATRSSIWPFVGCTMTSGSTSPVGRTICSTTCVDTSSSYGLGVADMNTTWFDLLDELVEPQRPVVHRRRQPEPVLDQRLLAGAVALVLAVELRHRDVRLVEHDEVVVGEVVEQRVRHLARRAAVEVARVVLDARARRRPRAASRGRTWCACAGAAPRAACSCSSSSASRSASSASMPSIAVRIRGSRRDVVRRREQHEPVELLDDLAGERVDRDDALDLVAEELDADRPLLVRREHLDRVAPHPELVAGERDVVALVLRARRGGRGSTRCSRSSPTSRMRHWRSYSSGAPSP